MAKRERSKREYPEYVGWKGSAFVLHCRDGYRSRVTGDTVGHVVNSLKRLLPAWHAVAVQEGYTGLALRMREEAKLLGIEIPVPEIPAPETQAEPQVNA